MSKTATIKKIYEINLEFLDKKLSFLRFDHKSSFKLKTTFIISITLFELIPDSFH